MAASQMTAQQKIALLSQEERKAFANAAREGNNHQSHQPQYQRQMKCFTCGGPHHKKECTVSCLWCKEGGHSLNDCPKRKTKTEERIMVKSQHTIECYQCNGCHHQNDCPVKCVQCWKKGHTANNCPERKAYNETASQYLVRDGQTLPSAVDNDFGILIIQKKQKGKKGKGKKFTPPETKPKLVHATKSSYNVLEEDKPKSKPKPTLTIVSEFSTEKKKEKELIDDMEKKLKAMELEEENKPKEDSNYTEEDDFNIDWDNVNETKIDFNDEEGFVEPPPTTGGWW
jgi:hypothetical protein